LEFFILEFGIFILEFIKIIRIPNLLIIILTQYLLRICIIGTFYGINATEPSLEHFDFLLLVISTVLIAAGGYVINDYFDLETDKVNKPSKIVIGKSLAPETAYKYYWLLTLSGNIIGFYLAFRVHYYLLGFIFPAISMMLWYYSVRYQKTALWGNLVISFLSAMVILIVWLFEFFALRANPINYAEAMKQLKLISIIVAAYALFAFLTTLIREMIKDTEDIEGDRSAGFRTLPIVLGTGKVKGLITTLGIITVLLLTASQFVLYRMNLMLVFWYLMVAVQPLIIYMIVQMSKAKTKAEFHNVSTIIKIIMVAGILSMQLFYISY